MNIVAPRTLSPGGERERSRAADLLGLLGLADALAAGFAAAVALATAGFGFLRHPDHLP